MRLEAKDLEVELNRALNGLKKKILIEFYTAVFEVSSFVKILVTLSPNLKNLSRG